MSQWGNADPFFPGEDPLEKGMAIHSNILAWRIPQTEEPGRLQPMKSQWIGHDWATNTHIHAHTFHCMSRPQLAYPFSLFHVLVLAIVNNAAVSMGAFIMQFWELAVCGFSVWSHAWVHSSIYLFIEQRVQSSLGQMGTQLCFLILMWPQSGAWILQPLFVVVQCEVARTHLCGNAVCENQPWDLACLLPSPLSCLACLEKIRVHLYL